MRKTLGEKEIKYIRNEIASMKMRLRQIENYRKKISEVLDGMSIEEAEKTFKPIRQKPKPKKKQKK